LGDARIGGGVGHYGIRHQLGRPSGAASVIVRPGAGFMLL
jgi:hypothetical protein